MSMTATEFENGLCRVGTSKVVHLVAPPLGNAPLCWPTGGSSMRGVPEATEPTCQRCLLARDAGPKAAAWKRRRDRNRRG